MARGVDCKDSRSVGPNGRRERVYLDYNATAPVRPAATAAVARALGVTGNPSSVHAEGRAARGLIEDAREKVAALVGASPRDVVFTSGGTEAANTVLSPGCAAVAGLGRSAVWCRRPSIVCVLEGARFGPDAIEVLPVDRNGIVEITGLERRLATGARPSCPSRQPTTKLACSSPSLRSARLTHEAGGLFHTDAVQAAGKIRLDIASLGVDAVTLSAHKIGGPNGVGAIVLNGQSQLDDRLHARRRTGARLARRYRKCAGDCRIRRRRRSRPCRTRGRAGAADGVARQARSRGPEARAGRCRVWRRGRRGCLTPPPSRFPASRPRRADRPRPRRRCGFVGVCLFFGQGSALACARRRWACPALADGAIRVSLGWIDCRGRVMRFCGDLRKGLCTHYHKRRAARPERAALTLSRPTRGP